VNKLQNTTIYKWLSDKLDEHGKKPDETPENFDERKFGYRICIAIIKYLHVTFL
jgi:hypothetical protein